jgi:thiosulfate dehydrogenase [quinone] large subunit
MTNTSTTRSIILLMRLAMGWIFVYAASHQVLVPGFSIAGFLGSTKTFHWLFAPFTAPGTDAVLSFLVSYGHLLIGLSLITGLMVRISGAFGIAMMVLYWMAHMDFPYISDTNYLLVDPHVLFALTLGLLVAVRAGHIYGLDGWISKQAPVQHNKALAWATA